MSGAATALAVSALLCRGASGLLAAAAGVLCCALAASSGMLALPPEALRACGSSGARRGVGSALHAGAC